MAGRGIGIGIGLRQGTLLNLTPEYKAVYNAMSVKPTKTDMIIQNQLMKRLVDGGFYAKAEFIDIFATHAGGSNINWANPGTFDPLPVNSPVFTPYEGYKGNSAASRYVNLKFNPTTQATKVSQNNICAIVGVGDAVNEDRYDFGGQSGSTYFIAQKRIEGVQAYCNSAARSILQNYSGITGAHVSMARNSGTTVVGGMNASQVTASSASNGLVNNELYACGWNQGGTPNVTNKTVRYVMLFSYLTTTEVNAIVEIIEDYLRNYNTGLMDYAVARPILSTKRQIIVPTSVPNNNEVIHPSVVDCGSPFNGYRYWQANTPYPNSDANYELPEIYASNDGINWVVPDGITNPLIPYPGNTNYSDVDLYFENNKLYLFYRTRLNPGYSSSVNVVESSDGITWNIASAKIAQADAAITLISPSIIKIGATYYMYAHIFENDTYGTQRTVRASSSAIDGPYENLEAVLVPQRTWHLSAYNDNGNIYLCSTGVTSQGFWLWKSTDGINFTGDNDMLPLIFATKNWEIPDCSLFYRPDLVKIGGVMSIYYSLHAPTYNNMGFQSIQLL